MSRGFKIGQLFGIDIRIDWSWLIIFLLVTWNLGLGFGQLHPNWTVATRWGLGAVAALLFFGSVLAHELAHSLVSKARGTPVSSITLHLFGGVSNIQSEPNSPSSEFVMAILGPATSLVIGGVLLWGTLLFSGVQSVAGEPAEALSQMGPIFTILLWLGTVNITVGLFNLVPGFPLDGGRILRSILWAITDNLRKATQWASWAGQAVAWSMIFAGIAMAFGVQIPLLGGGVGSGVWLALIGWFLQNASQQSYRRVVMEDVLQGIPVSRMMRENPPTVPPGCNVSDLVHTHIMGSDDQSFPVVENGEQIIGLVALEDVRNTPRDEWETTTVRDIMTPSEELVCVTPETDASEALSKLMQRDVRQLPVLSNRKLTGLLRRRDIVKWLQLETDIEA